MNVVDKYILENFDENIIVVTNTRVSGDYDSSGYLFGTKIEGVGVIRHDESFLIEKNSLKSLFRKYGSTWARIDYLHKYDARLTSKDVYGVGSELRDGMYHSTFVSKGRYNGNYQAVLNSKREQQDSSPAQYFR